MAKQLATLIAGEGRTVLTEDGTPWPVEGLEDPDTLYSRRRLADGDLIEKPAEEAVDAPAVATKPKKPEGGEAK